MENNNNPLVSPVTSRKNDIWTAAHKDRLIEFMLGNADLDFNNKNALARRLRGFILEGRTEEAMAKQIYYMARQVRLVHSNRTSTGQGSIGSQAKGPQTTYGYEELLPLIIRASNEVLIPDLETDTGLPGTSAAHNRRDATVPATQTTSASPTGVPMPAPSPTRVPDERVVDAAEGVAVDQRRNLDLRRSPRRVAQSASVMHELASISQQQTQLQLAAEDSRQKLIDVEKQKLDLETQKLEVEKKKLALEERKVAVEEQKVEVEKRKVAVEEQNAQTEKERVDLETQKLELEKQKLELEKSKLGCTVPGMNAKLWSESLKSQNEKRKREIDFEIEMVEKRLHLKERENLLNQ